MPTPTLTENERAATFIGWKPFACAGNPNPEWADEHGNPAPDMSDARNYMGALEGRNQYFRIIHSVDGVGDFYTCEFDGAIRAHADSVDGAVVKALAALWDAENGSKNS